jgi:hypothetical protein
MPADLLPAHLRAPKCRRCGQFVGLDEDELAIRHDTRSAGGLAVRCEGSFLPPAGEPPCLPSCTPVGTIGWPVPYERDKPHASTRVCNSPAHQEAASAWVHGITGHDGVFRTFARARRESGKLW